MKTTEETCMTENATLRQLVGLADQAAALPDSTLIMIDCQNTYTQGVLELEGVQPALDQAAELLDRARSAGIPAQGFVRGTRAGRASGEPHGRRLAHERGLCGRSLEHGPRP